ncbi:MAG: DUF1292 domain-containing protein [Candidatus Saccharibacteria bacterium]
MDHKHECGDDCGCEHEVEVLVIADDEGVEHEFELIAEMEIDDKNYVVLIPIDDDEEPEEDPEVIIMRAVYDDEDNMSLEEIEDDAEWEKVEGIWNAMLEEEEDEE